jgi:hypothetical protein
MEYQIYKRYFYNKLPNEKEAPEAYEAAIYSPNWTRNKLPDTRSQPKGHVAYQVRFGIDFFYNGNDSEFEINFLLCTYHGTQRLPQVPPKIWIRHKLPNKKHRDFIFQPNQLNLEYYLINYGYCNYAFLEFITDTNGNLFIKHRKNSTSNINIKTSLTSPDLSRLIQFSQGIIQSIPEIEMISRPNELTDFAEFLKPQLTEICQIISNFELCSQKDSGWDIIHQTQCQMHETTSMFSLKKLWES